MSEAKPLAIFIMGPTASGKTDLAMRLQDEINGEIISVDSALIYKGLDIGSAKPTRQELEAYPHHLIDILEPTESYSAADFCKDALRLMADITSRGKIPILAGGTMMYFRILIHGMSDLPSADPAVRAEIDKIAKEQGWPYVHGLLAEIDPQSAARIKPTDPQRIQRALEVYRIAGKTMTAFREEEAAVKSEDPLADFPYDVVQFAISPEHRSVLHQRIEQRFLKMCQFGFQQEVEALMSRSDLTLDMPSMRCVGYRQMWEHLEGKYDYDEMLHKGIVATRQLAKRQLTWLRGWQNLNWLYTNRGQTMIDAEENKQAIVDLLLCDSLKIINKRLKS